MKILIVSDWGGGVSLGYRLTGEGHDVSMSIKRPEFRTNGDGLLKKVEPGSYNGYDLVVLDDVNMGLIGEELRSKKIRVWGGTKWSDEIESDRQKGQNLFKEAGLHVIPSKDFSSLKDAIAFVKSSPKRYVAKPSGKVQEEKSLSYVGKQDDGKDMVSMLEHFNQKWASKIDKIEIQEFKKGIEVGISGFFNGNDFVEPIEVSFEHKQLMVGGIGPNTGEMGTSMVWMHKNKLYKETTAKVVPFLRKNNYVGYFDVNCIAEGSNIWPLEVTSRFGYPTIQLKMETITGNLGNFMVQLASGSSNPFSVSNPYSICVVLATAPFPYESKDIYKKFSEDQKVIFKTPDRKGVWPEEIRKEGNDWFLAGQSGFSMIVTGQGKNFKQAKEMAYKRVENIVVPGSFYRNDISDKSEKQLQELNQLGWFKN